jgi:hypothetical protein
MTIKPALAPLFTTAEWAPRPGAAALIGGLGASAGGAQRVLHPFTAITGDRWAPLIPR